MQLIGDKLSAVRGGRTLFAGISFTVAAGEGLLVTGPNGAGKTTLLRTIAGLLPPAAGTVILDGAAEDGSLPEHCHLVGHANAVKASLTVAENAQFWGDFLGKGASHLEAALETFALSSLRDIPAGYLSAGQKRRLGLTRLLLAPRLVWLLDEPTSSLDSAGQKTLEQAVNAHLRSGGIVVAATHVPLAYGGARELALGRVAQAA